MVTVKSPNQTENFVGCRVMKETRKWIEARKKKLGYDGQKQYITHLLYSDGLPPNPKGI